MMPLRRIDRPMFPELRHEVDRLFENFFGPDAFGFLPLGGTQALPALNVWENEERLFVEAQVPGLGMKDLDIQVQGNELTVKGQRAALEGENVVYHRQERGASEFVRFLALPVEVDPDNVEATLKDGVLTIVLPKAETARARKITVKTA